MSIDIHRLRPDRSGAAFELATAVFSQSSTLHRALRIGLDEYRRYLRPSFDAMVAQNMSVAASDSQTGDLLGCLIVSDFAIELPVPAGANATLSPLIALTSALCQTYATKRALVRGEAILVDMAAVAPAATGKGLYRRMRDFAHGVAQERGFSFVVGELSSSATQHVVLDGLGHRKMAEILFDDFVWDGTRPFSSITDPKSIILSEGAL